MIYLNYRFQIFMIILKIKVGEKSLWRILADFVADFVAGSTKPIDYQEVLGVKGRCGRGSSKKLNMHFYIYPKSHRKELNAK